MRSPLSFARNTYGTLFLLLAPFLHAVAEGAALAAAPELARKVVDLGTHRITYIRIMPPQLPALPQPPPPPVVQPTPAQLAEEEARAAKTYEHLSVSITVYPGGGDTPTVSDLSWWHEGKRYQAWSNVDFRLLSQVTQLETETHIFAWFPFIGEGSVEEMPAEQRPAGFSLFAAADTTPHYFVERTEDLEAIASTLAGLDYFHAYYQLHRKRLATAYAEHLAAVAAHEAERAKNPPKPVNTTIHFWKMPAATSP